MSSAFRLDEGFSEDTRSQAGSEMPPCSDSRMAGTAGQEPVDPQLPNWLLGMSEWERSGAYSTTSILRQQLLTTAPEFAYSLLRSLRTSSIAAIVDRLNPLLHIDPVVYLPPEITFEVFSYLDPHSLLRASTLSRSWRVRALDPRLWRRLFGTEGWSANARQVKDFEQTQRARFGDSKGKARARTFEEITDAESKSAKRRVRGRTPFGDDVTDTVMDSSFEAVLDSPRMWDEQHGTVEADEDGPNGRVKIRRLASW